MAIVISCGLCHRSHRNLTKWNGKFPTGSDSFSRALGQCRHNISGDKSEAALIAGRFRPKRRVNCAPVNRFLTPNADTTAAVLFP